MEQTLRRSIFHLQRTKNFQQREREQQQGVRTTEKLDLTDRQVPSRKASADDRFSRPERLLPLLPEDSDLEEIERSCFQLLQDPDPLVILRQAVLHFENRNHFPESFPRDCEMVTVVAPQPAVGYNRRVLLYKERGSSRAKVAHASGSGKALPCLSKSTPQPLHSPETRLANLLHPSGKVPQKKSDYILATGTST